MKVAIFSQFFPPEMEPSGFMFHSFSKYLASLDSVKSVDVICGFPNFPSGKFLNNKWKRLFYSECQENVRIHNVIVLPSDNKSNLKRIVNYTSYLLSSFFKGLTLRNPDVIIATSPPIFAALSALLVAKIKKSQFVLDVRDIWPESAIQMGSIKNPLVISILEKLELILYNNASLITVATPGMVEMVKSKLGRRFVPVEYIPCGVAIPEDKFLNRTSLSPFLDNDKNKNCILYAGLHGHAQNLITLIDAAAILRHRDDIVFYFVGAGPDKDRVVDYASELGIENIRFLCPVSRDKIREYFIHSVCAIVPLRDLKIFKNVYPSKTFELMSYGVPSIVGVGGEIENVIKSTGAGQAVSPENAAEYAEAILKYVDDPMYQKTVSASAFKAAKEQFDYAVVNKKFADLIFGNSLNVGDV